MATEQKRKAGRPKGSKNKATVAPAEAVEQTATAVVEDPIVEQDEDGYDVEGEDESDEPSMKDVVTALGKTVQALSDATPRRMHYANYKPTSSFNPTGNKKRKLRRKMYQNGFLLDINKLTDKEIALLDRLAPGSYIDGLVSVVEVTKGRDTKVNIIYDNSSGDKRSELKNHFRNFTELLRICVEGE